MNLARLQKQEKLFITMKMSLANTNGWKVLKRHVSANERKFFQIILFRASSYSAKLKNIIAIQTRDSNLIHFSLLVKFSESFCNFCCSDKLESPSSCLSGKIDRKQWDTLGNVHPGARWVLIMWRDYAFATHFGTHVSSCGKWSSEDIR